MNVTVEILSRVTVDQPLTTLVAAAVLTTPGSSIGFTPALPPGSAGLDLRLRVQSADDLKVDVGFGLDPANPPQPRPVIVNGVQVGTEPALSPVTQTSFGAWGGQTREIPFTPRHSFLIRRVGAV